jgi:hypothetical protein
MTRTNLITGAAILAVALIAFLPTAADARVAVGPIQLPICAAIQSAPIQTVRVAFAQTAADSDGDGLSDAFEQCLAERYAPVVYHSNHESNYPTNVDEFLYETTLWFYDDGCTPDLHHWFASDLIQADLPGNIWAVGECGSSWRDPVYSNDTRSRDKQRTFYIADVADQYRIGELDTTRWTTYYHAYPNDLGGVTVQYWRFYAYHDAITNHGGDWAAVDVVLGSNLKPVRFGFLGDDTISWKQPSDVELEGTHPHVFSDGGGHATYASGSGIQAYACSGYRYYHIDEHNRCTFTRQETWTRGHVKWCTEAYLSECTGAKGSTGSLLDLGEKEKPMNHQTFITYSGLWGSPGTFYSSSGSWGPAYDDRSLGSDGFITAWCTGMKRDAAVIKRECYPGSTSR